MSLVLDFSFFFFFLLFLLKLEDVSTEDGSKIGLLEVVLI